MQISESGIQFIRIYEAFKPAVYNDIGGRPTIGIGHLIKPGEDFSAGLTEAQAEALLMADLMPVEAALNHLVTSTCTQNQFDALCDFGFNLGVGALETMLGHGWDKVPFQIPRWDHVKGVEVEDLTRRRLAEVDLFNS